MTRSADIVKQLRLHARVGCDNPNIYHKAVNEIEWLRGQVKQLETIINGDWPKNYKVDQDRVSLPAYVVGLEKQNDKLKAEIVRLRALLERAREALDDEIGEYRKVPNSIGGRLLLDLDVEFESRKE